MAPSFVRATLAAGFLLPLAASQGTGSRNDTAACMALMDSAGSLLPNLTINVVEYRPDGTNYNDTANGGFDPNVAFNISEHCRFSANITTSPISSVRFEVWLPPADRWNQEFMMVGNGGDAGYVYSDTMVVPLGKYGFAVASTNTGHDGRGPDGSFARNNSETQIDFGYRAVHLTTEYSKMLVNQFYGQNSTYNYWLGCSSGGKQGLKEAQMFPEDYDGIITGSPAYNWAWLNGWTEYVNIIVNPVGSVGYIPPSSWTALHAEVLSQCDMNDGLNDSMILEPGKCMLDYSRFTCAANTSTVLNSTNCLTSDQASTLQKIYTNWTDPSTGELLFPAFNIGSEFLFSQSVTGVAYGPAPNYYLYQVLNETQLVQPILSPNVTVDGKPLNDSTLIQLTKTGNETDPGQIQALNPDLKPFFSRGGKLLMYVGGADTLIPTNSTMRYYKSVQRALGNTTSSLQLYVIEGMGHCSGGVSAYNFGGADQASTVVGGKGQSSQFDAKHDLVLAMRAWRENGTRPEVLVGAKYINNNISQGVQFTRKLCPWPMVGRYQGSGDPNDEASFECQM